jgi:hypothetical protein
VIIPTKSGNFALSEQLIAAFQAKYPAVQVREQILIASLWLERNPSRRPTKPLRFLDTWLKKHIPVPGMRPTIAAMVPDQNTLLAEGQKRGILPHPGESWAQYQGRLRSHGLTEH